MDMDMNMDMDMRVGLATTGITVTAYTPIILMQAGVLRIGIHYIVLGQQRTIVTRYGR